MQDTFLIPMPIPKKEKQEIQDTGETSPQIMWTDYSSLRTTYSVEFSKAYSNILEAWNMKELRRITVF